MFVKKNKSWRGTLLTYTIGYRENGKIKHKNIETIGYLEDLKKEFEDPIAHFKEIAKERTNAEVKELIIKNLNTKLIDVEHQQKNLGYLVLKKIYSGIDFKNFFKNEQANMNCEYNLNDIFSLLVYARILFPGSKKETYENKNKFFEKFDFSLTDVYRSLDNFSDLKEKLETLLWDSTKDKYNREVTNCYYDCTNYYFEIDYNDTDLIDEEGNVLVKGYRKRGPEKNHRPDPIISMGLLMDNTNIPLSYDLFPGNESEKTTLRPILSKTKRKYNINRTIVVADRGLNTSDNTYLLSGKNDFNCKDLDGYVYGQSVRGADKEFKEWVLDKKGYIEDGIFDENNNAITYRSAIFNKQGKVDHYEVKPAFFLHKSRIIAKDIKVKNTDGKRNAKDVIYQKQMVYYSQKYAEKQKKERQMMIDKANDLIKNPRKYNVATSYGAANYINNIKFDKDTGLIVDGQKLILNNDKIKEEEKYDGYYSIVTSELKMSDKEMRDTYKNLSKIEETFKITKTNLEARPAYVWTKEHIEGHFLTCFIALVMVRLLEKDLEYIFSIEKIIESLRNYVSTHVEHDIYIQSYKDEVIEKIEKVYGINLSRKYLSLQEIKNILKV